MSVMTIRTYTVNFLTLATLLAGLCFSHSVGATSEDKSTNAADKHQSDAVIMNPNMTMEKVFLATLPVIKANHGYITGEMLKKLFDIGYYMPITNQDGYSISKETGKRIGDVSLRLDVFNTNKNIPFWVQSQGETNDAHSVLHISVLSAECLTLDKIRSYLKNMNFLDTGPLPIGPNIDQFRDINGYMRLTFYYPTGIDQSAPCIDSIRLEGTDIQNKKI